jgi:CheY-like chemotaxis protein
LDAEEILLALGFDTVEVVATAADALKAVERTKGKIAFALLDANLGDHTSLPVGEELLRRGIPFAFATGYGKRLELPPSLAGNVAVVAKPYRRQDIAELVGLQLAPG